MTTLAVALIAAGLAAGVGALVALQLLPTGLSPMRNAVSQYGISRYRTGYRVQAIAFALAGAGAALGLSDLPQPSRAAVFLFVVFALARAAISWFRMDQPGTEPTATGRRHGLLALAAFGSATIAAGALARSLGRSRLHPTVASVTSGLGIAMGLSLLAMALDRRAGGRHFGLIERVFYLAMTPLLATVAVLVAGG